MPGLMGPAPAGLPPGVTVIERGWLSANNVVVVGSCGSAVVDTGYVTHAAQTVGLVEGALCGESLDLILNTHLHSDHCGGNAALQCRFPEVRTAIPPGQAKYVAAWNPVELTYEPTGQHCPQFGFDMLLNNGDEIVLGDAVWEVHAAPGHDPHSVILMEPRTRTLISADALWENGFGVVFPELEGQSAFDDVAKTLELIESLNPLVIIPGHGPVFTDLAGALDRAHGRLDSFVRNPAKHASHAAKVLIKFKLLEVQEIELEALLQWATYTRYFRNVKDLHFGASDLHHWLTELALALVKSGVARLNGTSIQNA